MPAAPRGWRGLWLAVVGGRSWVHVERLEANRAANHGVMESCDGLGWEGPKGRSRSNPSRQAVLPDT